MHVQNSAQTYWPKFGEINIEEDLENFANWLTALFTENPTSENIVALWIGLVKFTGSDNSEIPTVYVGGADNYDKDNSDWACDLAYLPNKRYAQPGSLKKIDVIAKTDNAHYSFLDWILPLAYCSFVIDEVIKTRLDRQLLAGNSNKLFIAIGYDGVIILILFLSRGKVRAVETFYISYLLSDVNAAQKAVKPDNGWPEIRSHGYYFVIPSH